jgi:Na+-driven multidrug efflux pump
MAVEGVALATIISQYVSAIVVVIILIKRVDTPYALDPKKLGINYEILKKILLLGLPAGLQGTLFSISNIILTSGINELDEIFIRGKTIAINIEGLVYTAMNSYLHASTAFTGQNYGAKKIDRVKKSIIYSVIQVTIVGFVGGQILNFFGEPLANLYIGEDWSNKQEVINVARELMNFMLSCYFLCGIMDTISGALRGLGYSMIPMIISIGAICVLRAIWVQFFFPMEQFHSLIGIYTIYPISWSIGLIALTVAIIIVYKKVKKRLTNEDLPPLPKTA